MSRSRARTPSTAPASRPVGGQVGGAGQAGRRGRMGNAAVQDQLRQEGKLGSPADAWRVATSGSPAPLPFQAELEATMGVDLSGVEAHLGTPEAKQGLGVLQAEAATIGKVMAFVEPNPSKETVAHEVAHVGQAGGGQAGSGGDAVHAVSSPQAGAEQHAEQAAATASRGEATEVGGTRAPNTLHRSFWGGVAGGVIGGIGGAVGGFFLGGPVGAVVGGIGGAVGGALAGDAVTQDDRSLTADEIAYARDIFGDSVDYSAITITRDSLISAGAPKTIGNTVHLKSDWGHFVGETMELTAEGRDCLIHEMGHVWQYQNGGLSYIPESLWAQLKAAVGSGDRGGAYNWREPHKAGTPWAEWNPEQQAEAIEDYNKALRAIKSGRATADDYKTLSDLEPYLNEVRARRGAP